MSTTSDRSQATRTAAHATLETLSDAGVDVVFGNPGTTEIPIIKALLDDDSPLRYVVTLHEGAAAAAAIGHALVADSAGVALVHAVPGAANALSMFANAWRSGVPLVLIVGQQDRRHQFLQPMLHAELTEIFRPVSKGAWEARTAAEVPDVVARAVVTATSAPAGPVLLSVPVDLWDEPVGARSRPRSLTPRRPGPASATAVERLADAIAEADAPVLVAGDRVGMARADAALVELAEAAGAPAWWAPGSSMANFPSTSPFHYGQIFHNVPSLQRALGGADLALFVGAELQPPILFGGIDLVPDTCRTMAICETPSDPLGVLTPELLVHGALEPTIRALTAELCDRGDTTVGDRAARIAADGSERRARLLARARADSKQSPLPGRAAIAAILDAAPEQAIVVDESVSNAWVSLLGSYDDACSYLSPARSGALGHAVGVAAGAAIASPGRGVLVIVGDGALAYGIQGLWTLAREQLPVVVCVLNNGGYSILKDFVASPHFSPELAADPAGGAPALSRMSIDQPAVDSVGGARAWGLEAVRVDDVDTCQEAVSAAFASGRPWLIDVPIADTPRGQ